MRDENCLAALVETEEINKILENENRWKMNIKKWYRDNIKVRIGGLRKPMYTKEGDCPYCNEILYHPKRCVFCGQRLIDDLKVEDIGDIDFGYEESEEDLFY